MRRAGSAPQTSGCGTCIMNWPNRSGGWLIATKTVVKKVAYSATSKRPARSSHLIASPELRRHRPRVDQSGVDEVLKFLADIGRIRQHLDHQDHREPCFGVDLVACAVRAAPQERADRAHAAGAIAV